MTLKIKGHHAVACLRQWQGIALHDLTRPRKPMRHHHNRPCLTGQAVKSDGRLAHLEFSNLQPVPRALQHDPRGDDQKRSEQAEGVERFAFYERVKKAYAIVVTGELQPWGNFILRKGVIGDTLRT